MKLHFFHLGLAVAISIIAFVCYGFWYNTISNKSADVANLKSQIDSKTETLKRVASARSALAQISGAQASLKNYFVPETGVVSFIDNLETHGKSFGSYVSVLSVSAGSNSVQPTLTFAVSIKGTFDAVMRTVGAIEYLPYDLSISQLSLVQDEKKTWHADLNLIVGSISSTNTPSP